MNRKILLTTCIAVCLLSAESFGQSVSASSDKGTTEVKKVTEVISPPKGKEGEGATTNRTTETTTTTSGFRLENNYVRLNTGVILLNPYTFSAVRTNAAGQPVRDLNDGDTEGRFFLDVGANWVWAWNHKRRFNWLNGIKGTTSHPDRVKPAEDACKTGVKFFWKDWSILADPDLQGHLWYVAKGDKEATPSAIVGSGEFGLEVTVGIPFYRSLDLSDTLDKTKDKDEQYKDAYRITETAHWVGAIISLGGVTDSTSFDIHGREFYGIGYRGAYKQFWDKKDTSAREVAVSFQIGYAQVDSVKFADPEVDHSIALRHGDVPHYRSDGAFAIEGEFYIPVSDVMNVVFGARLYRGVDPNSWNAYVAATFSMDNLFKAITGKN